MQNVVLGSGKEGLLIRMLEGKQDPERDAKGRFLPGNNISRGKDGRSAYKRAMQMAVEQVFTADEIAEVLEALLREAKTVGKHIKSKQLVLSYALGKPVAKIEHTTDRTKLLEALLADNTPLIPDSDTIDVEMKVIEDVEKDA